jgi:hypothetical protein
MLLEPSEGFSLVFLVTGLFWVASTLSFLSGGYELLGRSLPRAWYAVAAVAAAAAIGTAIVAPSPLAMAPLALFQCLGLAGSGVTMLRHARRRAGGWMYGVSLILLGLHVLDAPIVTRLPWLVAWGFGLALSLEVVAALGMVVLHYEHARERQRLK